MIRSFESLWAMNSELSSSSSASSKKPLERTMKGREASKPMRERLAPSLFEKTLFPEPGKPLGKYFS